MEPRAFRHLGFQVREGTRRKRTGQNRGGAHVASAMAEAADGGETTDRSGKYHGIPARRNDVACVVDAARATGDAGRLSPEQYVRAAGYM
jgi:hypothetical protein